MAHRKPKSSKSSSDTLTTAQRERLKALEAEIATYIDDAKKQNAVYVRLWEIKRDRLYKDHDTIEQYCREVWDIRYETFRRRYQCVETNRIMAHGPDLKDTDLPPKNPS